MKTKLLFSYVVVSLLVSVSLCQSTKPALSAEKDVAVAKIGKSSIATVIGKIPIRILISNYQINIGKPEEEPPSERKNNCTYSSYPCSQVSNLQIWVKGKELFVPRSVFADCTDVRSMRIEKNAGAYVLILSGGDASEAYGVKIFFNTDQITKRDVYDLESNSLRQTTTYMPIIVD